MHPGAPRNSEERSQRPNADATDGIACRSDLADSASDCGVRGPTFESHRRLLVFIATAAAICSLGRGLRAFKKVSKCFSMAPHIRSHIAPCSCFPKKVSLQLSSEQSVGDVGITQLDWKRVPQARSCGRFTAVPKSIRPCIIPGSLNRVPVSAAVRAGGR